MISDPRTRPSRSTPPPKELLVGRALKHLGRALLKRCPNCGSGGLFTRWVVMRRHCPRCHLILDRNEDDYFIGSYVVNFVTAELLIVTAAFATIYLAWPDVPWDALKWGLMATIVPVPFLFYPWAKTIWLGIDLTFRPPTLLDFEGHGENIEDPELVPPLIQRRDLS
ncbi:MAG: DUF983 domain-containing protein [Gemmatimonadales bacterium]|nr:MAG: DUF983 domain-containing protein [Gemmatimonadales bacterium]